MNMFLHSPADVTDLFQAKKERVNHHWANRIWQRVYSSRKQLQDAVKEVKILSGFLPICATCKLIRNDQDEWV